MEKKSNRLNRSFRLVAVLMAFSLAASVMAGIVVTHKNGAKVILSGNTFRSISPEGGGSIYRDGRIIMTFPNGKYWTGTVADFCSEMKKMMPEQPSSASGPKGQYTIKKLGVEKIAGRNAVHYEVNAKEGPILEAWINEEAAVGKVILKADKQGADMDCMQSEGSELNINGIDYSAAIDELDSRGLVVKMRTAGEEWAQEGYAQDDVISIEIRDIAPDEIAFKAPDGYVQVKTIKELYGM